MVLTRVNSSIAVRGSEAGAGAAQGRARERSLHPGAEAALLPALLLTQGETLSDDVTGEGNSPTITATSTTIPQPARPFTAVKTAGTNTTHSDSSGKSQVSFLCLSST